MGANTEHKSFLQPADPNISIWRYMDLAKFLSLISSKSLFFARSDKLGDPFEGSLTGKSLEALAKFDDEIASQPDFKGWQHGKASEQLRMAARQSRSQTFINCWHMNSHESAAMWSLYGLSNQGIAIRSTYRKLRDILPSEVFMGKVTYCDYDSSEVMSDNLFDPFLFKRISFEHEQECRAIYSKFPSLKETNRVFPVGESGFRIKVDLSLMIENIYLHPNCPDWQLNAIGDLISKFGLNLAPERSRLGMDPVF